MLIWMEPRAVQVGHDEVYPEVQHWLIDDDGRILAILNEPRRDNPLDSYDVQLKFGERAYAGFISVDHAKAWAETESQTYLEKKKAEPVVSTEGVVAETAKKE